MELRNGTWTSQARKDDATDILRYARRIEGITEDQQILDLVRRIKRKARDLESDL